MHDIFDSTARSAIPFSSEPVHMLPEILTSAPFSVSHSVADRLLSSELSIHDL
jgi:hypothetical protein